MWLSVGLHRHSLMNEPNKLSRNKPMSVLDKAKQISDRIAERTDEVSSDEIIADTITKAAAKQESVNALCL